jgi:hypothetical protein
MTPVEREAVRQALDLLREVLDDEETGAGGWGPDVTMVPKLEEAVALLEKLK